MMLILLALWLTLWYYKLLRFSIQSRTHHVFGCIIYILIPKFQTCVWNFVITCSREGVLRVAYLFLLAGFCGLVRVALEVGDIRVTALLTAAIACGYVYQVGTWSDGLLALSLSLNLCFSPKLQSLVLGEAENLLIFQEHFCGPVHLF
jgi:hypothetical protein